MKPPQRAAPAAGDDTGRRESSSATIEAKPQIRHVIGDVTRFMPTALRVKREMKDAKGHIIKPATVAAPQLPGVTSLLLPMFSTFVTFISHWHECISSIWLIVLMNTFICHKRRTQNNNCIVILLFFGIFISNTITVKPVQFILVNAD